MLLQIRRLFLEHLYDPRIAEAKTMVKMDTLVHATQSPADLSSAFDFSSPLPLPRLEELEAELCRVSLRKSFRQFATHDNDISKWTIRCCARLIGRLLKSREVSQQQLHAEWEKLSAHSVTYRGLNAFLNSNPRRRRPWYAITDELLRLLLLGTDGLAQDWQVHPSQKTLAVARIRRFFFGPNWEMNATPSFFDSKTIHADVPVNDAELSAELRAMTRLCHTNSYERCKIVIATGNELDLGGENGREILRAVSAGAACYILIPSAEKTTTPRGHSWRKDARNTLNSLLKENEEFHKDLPEDLDDPRKKSTRHASIAQRNHGRLLLLELPLLAHSKSKSGPHCWPFQYLGSPFRFAFFKSRARPDSETNRTLITVRRKHGSAGPAEWIEDPSHEEVARFDDWQRNFAQSRPPYACNEWLAQDLRKKLLGRRDATAKVASRSSSSQSL